MNNKKEPIKYKLSLYSEELNSTVSVKFKAKRTRGNLINKFRRLVWTKGLPSILKIIDSYEEMTREESKNE